MREGIVELLIHAVAFVAYTAVGAVFAGFGVMFEYRSYVYLSSGEMALAAWIGALGFVLVAFAYLVVRDKAVGEFGALRAQL